MRIMVRDQNGNSYAVGASKFADIEDIESSRLEGLSVELSDNAETIIVNVVLEEV